MSSLGAVLRTRTTVRIAEIVAVFVPLATLLAIGLPLADRRPALWQALVWGANVLTILVVWAGLRLRGQYWDHFGLHGRWPGRRAAFRVFGRSMIALLAGIGAFVLGAIVGGAVLGVPEGADYSGYDYFAGNLPLLLGVLVAVWVASSFGEEVVYRGFLITRLAELWGGGTWATRAAVVVAGVVFGLIHFTWGPVGIIETTFMGIALGAVYVRFDRSLWVVILAHACMDTVLMVQMFAQS